MRTISQSSLLETITLDFIHLVLDESDDVEAWKILDDHFSSSLRFPSLREFRIIHKLPQIHVDVLNEIEKNLKQKLNLMNERGILVIEIGYFSLLFLLLNLLL
jgi:hypothetical protein